MNTKTTLTTLALALAAHGAVLAQEDTTIVKGQRLDGVKVN